MKTTCLTCDGITIGDVVVPPFEVSSGEYVGLAEATTSYEKLHELMQVLAGFRPTTNIHVTGKSSVILAGFEYVDQTRLRTISDFSMALGMSRAAAEGAFSELGLKADLPYGNLQLTPRLRLELRSAWSQRTELLVFSTAGLDPLGITSVATDVSNMLGPCSAVHVFSMAGWLMQHYESLNVHSKVVPCNLLKGT